MLLTDGLYRVVTPHFCAGFVVSGGKVTDCAPILRKRLSHWQTRAIRVGGPDELLDRPDRDS